MQRSAVVQLCRRLEGVPLAIEIAAARVRLLTPTQLLDRLDRSLDLPAARLADLPERQRTLRSTLDWSYDLLAPGEQALLAALSTFVGGASLSAIEEVISIDGDVLESLAILADHSLIGVDAWVIDAPRFTMLETVRDYAREKLEAAGLATATDEAHRAWVRGLAERASAGLIGVEHDEWLERLELESGNIRTAGTRANAAGDPQALVHAGYRLWLWLWARHHTREARLWLERALDFIDTLDDRTTAQLQWALAGAAVEQGDNEAAVSRLSAAIELFTALDDREGLALCKFIDGSLAPLSGEPDRAIERLTSGAEDLQASGNVFVASICWSMTGVFHAQLGRFQEAETYFDRSLSQAESIDNAMLRGTTYASRGFARLDRGAVDEAAADFAAGAAWAWAGPQPRAAVVRLRRDRRRPARSRHPGGRRVRPVAARGAGGIARRRRRRPARQGRYRAVAGDARGHGGHRGGRTSGGRCSRLRRCPPAGAAADLGRRPRARAAGRRRRAHDRAREPGRRAGCRVRVERSRASVGCRDGRSPARAAPGARQGPRRRPLRGDLDVAALARAAGLSRAHFSRVFRATSGRARTRTCSPAGWSGPPRCCADRPHRGRRSARPSG